MGGGGGGGGGQIFPIKKGRVGKIGGLSKMVFLRVFFALTMTDLVLINLIRRYVNSPSNF